MSAARVVLSGFEHQPLPEIHLKNGDISDARTLLVHPAMPVGYHWVPVAGVAPEDALDVLNLYIMSALNQLQNYPPAQTTEAGRRKMAIVLGTSRAVMTKHYRLLSYADFIEEELAAAVISATLEANGKITYTTTATTLTKDLALTNEEMAVVATLLSSSLGVLPVQGYSIMRTGHHYLTERNSPSRKAFAVIEKQFWSGDAVKNWFAADIAMLQDCAWHKSGHPVKLSIKESTARDERIAAMLREAGVGSAASRLPAMETQLLVANSYLALLNAVDPMLKMFGGCADAAELGEIFRVIKSWPWTTTGSVDHVPDTWPQSIQTRAQALNWLGEVLVRNEAKVAYCYGFYCGFTEQSQTLSIDRLRTSYSLSKLERQCNGAFFEGVLAYSECNAVLDKKKQEG